jgi:hypothetical protein
MIADGIGRTFSRIEEKDQSNRKSTPKKERKSKARQQNLLLGQ